MINWAVMINFELKTMFEYVGSKKGKQNGFVPTNNDYDIGKARIFETKRMLCDLLFLYSVCWQDQVKSSSCKRLVCFN